MKKLCPLSCNLRGSLHCSLRLGFRLRKLFEPPREKMCHMTCAPIEDSNQSAHPHGLVRLFFVRMNTLCILGDPKCVQWRFWSDCANAQADLNLRWAHIKGTFSDDAVHLHCFVCCNILNIFFSFRCGDPLIGHPSLTQDRHRDHLQKCVQSLHRYSEMIEDNDIVLGAQCLRRGLRRLGSITGRVTSEDILDVIFKDFCIGK